ncbi:hypothetical protein RND81_04G098500 [Saponaria officinalis]|uniref:Protein kinase domain-containing protein n=1 Tax=Saponaria officinalis TaxID=3572 RepID=A0AAW1LJP8_SAPOF
MRGLGSDHGMEIRPSTGGGEGGVVLNSGFQGVNVSIRNSNYVSLQTGEEFSSVFIRDRLTPKVAHGPPVLSSVQNREMGGGSRNEQMGYEDLSRILRLQRLDSECSSDGVEVSSAHGCAAEVDSWNHVDRRCHVDDSTSGQGSGLWEVNGVSKFDTDDLGARVPPVVIPHLQHSCNAYESGSSDSSQSGNLKILCSFGGRILPRPSDAKLRYVGGETHIISVKRNISWAELVHKVSGKCNQPHTIKYQLPGEDLDALISVSSDEDIRNMLEECSGTEMSIGSQRLRIFLIPTVETENKTSGTLQQAAADYEYVVAVNGLVDLSPRKTSGEQLFTGIVNPDAVLDPIPSFRGDSPSSFHHLESKDGVSFSQELHLGKGFPNTAMSAAESPLLSTKPVQCKLSTGAPQWHEGSLWQGNVENNSSCNATEQQFDNLFGKPSLQGQESHFQAHHRGNCLVTPPLMVANQNNNDGQPSLLEGMPVHNERYMSQVGSRGFMLGSVDSIDSHHGMIHAYSDSQLHQYGDKASYCSRDGMSPPYPLQFSNRVISSQALSTPLQDEAVQLQENVRVLQPEVNNQLVDIETSAPHYRVDMPMPLPSDPLHCNMYVESCHEITSGRSQTGLDERNEAKYYIQRPQDSDPFGFEIMNMPHLHQGKTYQNVSPSNTVDLNLLNQYGDHNNPNALVHQDTTSSSIDATSASKQDNIFDVVPNHKHSVCQPCNFTVETTSESLVRSQGAMVESHGQNQQTNLLSGVLVDAFVPMGQQTVTCRAEEASQGQLLINALDGYRPMALTAVANEISRAEPSNMHNQKQLEPLVFIEDMSLVTPQAVEFSSKVTSHDDKSTGVPKDDAFFDAMMAEIESGLSGLQLIADPQIIRNADIEELKELGSGTYGTVYHGKWRGSDVAVKRIKKSCFSGRSSEQERLTRDFWREAQILSRLHHPNVVAFYGVVPNETGGTLATVTEFMVNGSLWNVLLKKDRTLDHRRKLLIAMDAAFGMEYLHSKNIVHFDLKCDNLLVDMRDLQRPICKVGDFGLSRIKRNTLVSGGVRGTLPWMAPELLNGSSNKVSEKVDVFSFGIAMWEILTGEEPYANMHCGTIIGGILKNILRPPIPGHCDPEWRNLMEQCWSANPDLRPSFTEVTNRLCSMSAALQSRGQQTQKSLQ